MRLNVRLTHAITCLSDGRRKQTHPKLKHRYNVSYSNDNVIILAYSKAVINMFLSNDEIDLYVNKNVGIGNVETVININVSAILRV